MEQPQAEYGVRFATGGVVWHRTVEDARAALETYSDDVLGPTFPASIWHFDMTYPYAVQLVEEHDPFGAYAVLPAGAPRLGAAHDG